MYALFLKELMAKKISEILAYENRLRVIICMLTIEWNGNPFTFSNESFLIIYIVFIEWDLIYFY